MRKKQKSNISNNENSRKGYTLTHCPSMQSFKNLPYVLWTQGSTFGEIPGIPIGSLFPYRIDCSRAGIHKPTVAGIHGNSKEGCYSICVSGGYPEDVDTGNHIKFTGSGGRSLKGTKDQPKNLRTAPQDHDMELNNSNASLISSYNNQKAIRVVRGPKSHFHHSPINCYRYDGMYRCTAYSYEKGSSGFSVYLFTLERLPNQPELASLPRSLDDPLFQPIHKQISNYRQRNPVEINNSSISSPGSSSDVIVASSSQSHQSPISSGHTFCTEDNYSSSSTLSSLTSCFDSTESFSSPNLSRVSKVSTRSTTSKASESSIASNCVYPDSSPFKVPKQKTNSTSNIASASLSSRSSNSDKSNFPRTLMGCRIFSPFEPSSSAVENESSSPHDPLSTSSSLSKYFQEPSFSTISPNTEAALNEIFQFPSTTSDTSLSV
ncbi:hypothetical protein HMI56_002741 [Coelomomyces lativittatus]|nr:hypothetical protein HMI56_002741 [Coelomomyces lativittatus]